MTDYTPFKGTSAREPRLELLEQCWSFSTPIGRTLTCGIYRTTAPGVEVRAGYGPDDLIRSQVAIQMGPARQIAADWKQAVIVKGGFVETTTGGPNTE